MLPRSALSRLCVIGAAHGRQTLASCISATGTENFISQPAASLCDSSSKSFATSQIRPRSSSSKSRSYEQSRFAREFKLIDYLGRGSYGIVCAALNTLDMQTYAIKCIPFFGQQLPEVLNEVRTMARIPPHANVIRYFSSWMESSTSTLSSLFDACTKTDNSVVSSCSHSESASSPISSFRDASQVLYIQMEYCHGSLRSWLQNRKELDPPYAVLIFNQMAKGLQHLHCNGLLHLDIKPENCLHIDDQVFKISDFGSSRLSDQTALVDRSGYFGTESYAAPECKESSQSCSTKSDVFSLGLCLMELFTVFNTGMERALAFDCIRKRSFSEIWMTKWPNVAAVIKSMTMTSPEDRPSLKSMIEWSSTLLEPRPSSTLISLAQIEEQPEAK